MLFVENRHLGLGLGLYQFTYSRIPLVRSSSELIVHRTRKSVNASLGHPRGYQESPQNEPQSLSAATISFQGLLGPILRANPFSEGTDLFCRLPCSCKRRVRKRRREIELDSSIFD